MKDEKNNRIFKKEDLGSFERKETRLGNSSLAGGERIRSISAEFIKPTTNRMDTMDRNSINDRRRDTLNSQKGYNKETVKLHNKTEKEVNSLVKFRLRLNIKLHDIKQFFLTLKKQKK
jgi:hypothetical protein